MDTSLGEGSVGTKHIGDLHDLGYLPVLVKALPEGVRVNIRVPMWTIRETIPEFYWVTNYLETQLSAEAWKPITSATMAYEYHRLFTQAAEHTGSPLDFVQWQGHDFSFRGMSGITDAFQSGAGHLLSFYGTDTIGAIDYLEEYYGGKLDHFIGGSVPATEHSVMCMGGHNTEIETFRRLITDVYPKGIISIVSDTWDFWKVITEYALELKDVIMARNGKVVFRPDSCKKTPAELIFGDTEEPEDTPAHKGAIKCLWDIFGGTTNSAGYKVLDQHVGLIYGDSITLDIASNTLWGLESKGFASCNNVFGIGSRTYQYCTRDTFGTAIKATFGEVGGEERELSKAPKTDSGTKNSACGLLRVEYENGNFVLYDRQTREQEDQGYLRPLFQNGNMVRYQTISDIRNLLHGENIDEQIKRHLPLMRVCSVD